MNSTDSSSDFAVLLRAERAVAFIFFDWSAQAILSQRVMQQWEHELAAQPHSPHFTLHQLAPDKRPFTWKWVNEANGDSEAGERGCGSVVWLKNGSVVGFIPDAARAGIKTLNRITNDCFVLGKIHTPSVSASQNETPFDSEWLQILCCPETHQSLALAPAPLIENLNQQISAGHLHNRVGDTIPNKIDAGLIRTDGRYLYPIR